MTVRFVVAALLTVFRTTPLVAQAPPAPDTLPAHYSLLFERGPLRVLRFAGAPGDKTSMHAHPPHFAYVIKGGLVRFTYPNGQAIDAPLKTGQSLQVSRPLTHSVEVLASDSVSVLVMEYHFPDSSSAPRRP